MLEVTFFEDNRKRLSSFVARGHANTADYGEDIVCAAVSAVLQAARLGLMDHVGLELEAEQESGSMEVRWPLESRDDARVCAIVHTAALAVEQIASQYPKHVRFLRAEEQDA